MRHMDCFERSGLRDRFWHGLVRGLTALYGFVLRWLDRRGAGRPCRQCEHGLEILLTGTFHSLNWQAAHLLPLADCAHVARLIVVATGPVPPHPKIEWHPPARWLVWLFGAVLARLLSFFGVGLRRRPHWVGGFHLLFNGMAALVLARLIGAQAMYFCVGGEAEVRDGGLHAENRLFERLAHPDPVVERRLLEAVRSFELVLTMGSRAQAYFRAHGRTQPTEISAGGLDATRYAPSPAIRAEYDIVFVGRLVPIKRVELLLEAAAQLRQRHPLLRVLVVGEGPQRVALEALAKQLDMAEAVTFAGAQTAIEDWLRRARIFVLTSRSEGLSLALIEAMLCGLPAVVPEVGDLPDLVADGVNGYLITVDRPEAYAEAIERLLAEPERRNRFAQAARCAALRYERRTATRRWDAILSNRRSDGLRLEEALLQNPKTGAWQTISLAPFVRGMNHRHEP